MPRQLKTEAIVFKKKHLLNKDQLLTLFTEEFGKTTVVAKGVKKLISTRSARIQTGNLITVQLSGKGERLYLQQADLISGFSQIKKDQQKVSYLYIFFFILDRLLPESQKEIAVYNLTKKFLIGLSNASAATTDNLALFIHRLLSDLGYSNTKRSLTELISFTENIIQEKIPFTII